jgi:hypothetical protein
LGKSSVSDMCSTRSDSGRTIVDQRPELNVRSKAAYAWVTGSTFAAYRVAALMLPSRLWFCRASNPAQGFRVDPHNVAQRARDRPPQRAGGAGGSSGRQPFQGCPIRLSLPETWNETAPAVHRAAPRSPAQFVIDP